MLPYSLDKFVYLILVACLLAFSLLTAAYRLLITKKIQKTYPTFRSQLRDAILSLITPMFFIPSILICSYLSRNHIGFIYHDIHQYGMCYFIFSLFLVTLVHDTYYYWIHRLLHTRFLFEAIHSVHHVSCNPTVVTFFAMHPLEDILMSLSIPLCAFIFPINDTVFTGAYFLYLTQAIYAHSGFEWFKTKKHSICFNTSYAHNMHHQFMGVNYSYFYNIWDRIGGTLCTYPMQNASHRRNKL